MRNTFRAAVGTYQRSSQDMRPVARIWPNGEFSLGYAKKGEEGNPKEEWAWTGGHKGLTQEELNVRLAYLDGWLEVVAGIYSVSGRLAAVMLTLSTAPNSDRQAQPVKYGLHGLTGHGKKMIRSGAYLLENRLGREDVVVTTLTLPKMSKSERIKVAQSWGLVVNHLVKWMSRALLRVARPPVIIGCVEIQSRRLESSGEAYLHLHLLHPAYSNAGGTWAIDTKALLTWWQAELERVLGTTLTHQPRVEMDLVRDSLEFYLAKYLGKGGDDHIGQFVADLGYESIPGQWWICSKPMRDAIWENTLSGENCGALLEAVVTRMLEEGDLSQVEYLLPVDMMIGDRSCHVGWVGRLVPGLRDELTAMLRTDYNLD